MNSSAAESPTDGRPAGLAVWLIAAGQTIVWAALFYSFAALLLSWEADLGWSKTDIAFGLTLALLVAAVASPIAGRIVDMGHGRLLLGAGSLFGALCLALLAIVESQASFLALWALIGLAHASCLYEPCFALVTRTRGKSARAAITRITLCAGFASTIAFPLGAILADSLGWRGAVVVFAAFVALLGAPLLIVGSTLLGDSKETGHDAHANTSSKAAVKAALRRREFWLLAVAFPMIALNHGILLNHIMPILVDRGLAQATAVTVASLIGPAQVAGRLLMTRFDHRVSAINISVVAFVGLSCASLVLFLAGASVLMAFAFAVTQGAAYGLTNILRPVVTAESLGRTGFGAISGLQAVPNLAGFAIAPFLGAVLAQIGGYRLSIIAAGCLALLGLLLIVWLALIMRRSARVMEVEHNG